MVNTIELNIDEIVEGQVNEILENLEFRKCTKCKVEKVLNGENFYKSKRSVDGFDEYCKKCCTERYYNCKGKNKSVELPKTYICKKCSTEYTYTNENFRVNHKTKTGLNYTCVFCDRIYYKQLLDKDRVKVQNQKRSSYQRCKSTKQNYDQTLKGKYSSYKSNAKLRGLEFELTFEQFCLFHKRSCTYCGIKIKNIGIDRVDTNLGYLFFNCVPCCADCNRAKLAMSAHDYIKLCTRVARYNNKKLSKLTIDEKNLKL